MAEIERATITYARPLVDIPEGWCLPSVGAIADFERSKRLGQVATHHPVLHQVADPIPADAVQSRRTRALVDKLKRVADSERAAGRNLVGLAAPQLGESRRVFLANLTLESATPDFTDLTVMINPRLEVAENSRRVMLPGGCFSCGPLSALVERPTDLVAAWTDMKGKPQEQVLQSYGSIVVGHENDHLNGILFPDRAVEQRREIRWVQPEQHASGEYQAANKADEPWPVICPVEQWEAMKRADASEGPKFRFENFDIAA